MLSIGNLSKSYGNVQALRNVSLEIPPGMFGLLGPNGAGKSSLMRTVATLQDPDGGSITFDGYDVTADKDRVRRTLGYLPQDFGLRPKVIFRCLVGEPMSERKTMTLNLSEPEMDVLESIATRKGLTKTALIRQALRLYQSVDARLERGEKILFENPLSKEKAELVVL